MLFNGCAGAKSKKRAVRKRVRKPKAEKIKEPEKIKMPEHKYGGLKYRSPFSSSGRGSAKTARVTTGKLVTAADINPDGLKVTGYFSDREGKYAILSGVGEFFIVKNGRLFTEDKKEVIGVAAIIKDNKIVLITDENNIYDFTIPE